MLRFEKSEDTDPTLPARANRANKVLGFDGTGEMTVYDTAATYAAPSVTQSGTGAVTRPITDKAKESVSVTDFGAIGNGIADDTNALQNALNAHNNVYIPPGTYRVTATLEIAANKTLFGAGNTSIIKANSNAFDTIALISSQAQLRDLMIDGGNVALRLYGKTTPCINNSVTNLVIKNVATGIELDGYANGTNICARNSLRNIVIQKPTQYGVHMTISSTGTYPDANTLSDIHVESLGTNISEAGFYIEAARYNNALLNCRADLDGAPDACVRIGHNSDMTLIVNLGTDCGNLVPNIRLDNGSENTSIINLYSNSNGAAILDNSGGHYSAVNAGFPVKNNLQRSAVTDLTTTLQRYAVATVDSDTAVNLSITTYLADATDDVITIELPTAATANKGAVITVKKTDDTANNVTISEDGGNGPDGRSFVLGSQYDIATVMSDGNSWRILSSNLPRLNTRFIDGVTTYHPDLTRALHLVSAFGGDVTVELPPANAAQSVGRMLTIKKTDASTNVINITVEGGTGPDSAVQTISARYKTVTVLSDGGAWHVVNKYV